MRILALALMLAALIPSSSCSNRWAGYTTVYFCPAATAGKMYFGSDSATWPERFVCQVHNADTCAVVMADYHGWVIGAMDVYSLEERDDLNHYESEIEIYLDVDLAKWRYIENSEHILVYFKRAEWPPPPR